MAVTVTPSVNALFFLQRKRIVNKFWFYFCLHFSSSSYIHMIVLLAFEKNAPHSPIVIMLKMVPTTAMRRMVPRWSKKSRFGMK